MNVHTVNEEFFGERLTIETGKMAKQADGSVTVRYGETVVFAAVVSSRNVREEQDYFPLMVDYRERFTAAGRFRGGYLKREGKPTQKEVLVARLTDRPIRPLFEDGFMNEVQVNLMVVSADDRNDPDTITILAASAALSVSPLPFHGPVGAVRVGKVDGTLVINPDYEQREASSLDLLMAGNRRGICMVEGSADNIGEEAVLEALDFGYEAIRKQLEIQERLIQAVSPDKREYVLYPVDPQLLARVNEQIEPSELRAALFVKSKRERNEAVDLLYRRVSEKILEQDPELSEKRIKEAFKKVEKDFLRKTILDEGIRADGRGLEDVRDIWIETGLLPCTHGSALFTRGETQALAVTTLGGGRDTQRAENITTEIEESFYLHYTFPGYSVGECKPNRGPGRREIGHGELAQRALMPVIPKKIEFPYVIRVTSDILESNGSSSMASVCAGSLSLMDAGVPTSAAVSGIAMGLIKEDDRVAVLSDILGLEDALGDMDFKVTGTENGITAFQMDIKIDGITREIMKQALSQATRGRMHILELMKRELDAPRELSKRAPRIFHHRISTEKIGAVIGPGGKVIRGLCDRFGVSIDVDDDGVVTIKGDLSENAEQALEEIKMLTSEIEKGKVYKGRVVSITPYGAFIECLPGKEALLHISRIARERINQVSDVLSEGDTIEVKCTDIDEKGRAVLSRKELL